MEIIIQMIYKSHDLNLDDEIVTLTVIAATISQKALNIQVWDH